MSYRGSPAGGAIYLAWGVQAATMPVSVFRLQGSPLRRNTFSLGKRQEGG